MPLTRRPSRGIPRVRPKVQEEVLVPLGAVARPNAVGVADLVKKLGELEKRLHESEQDRAADAELIGNMLAEIGDRDRRLRSLEAQLEAEGDRVRALEIADASTLGSDERVAALENALALYDGVFGEVLRRLSHEFGNAEPIPSELHDLLAVTLASLDVTRAMTGATNEKVEQILLAVHGGPEVERGLLATLRRTQAAEDSVSPVDRAVAKVIDRLRDIERRERELAILREGLLEDATKLVAGVRALSTALGQASLPPERQRPALRRRPSSLNKFRR